MMQIAVLGHGVLGSGVCEVLKTNQESIKRRAGQEISVKRILDLREFPDLPYSDLFTKDFNDILSDPDIRVVAEVMGGISPAFEYAMAALQAGKSVVTSNKELVAAKGDILLATAKENNVRFLFEASVGGGIPIIRPLHQCLAANEIDGIAGILNGTTNFILTKMIKEKLPFGEALSLAQQLGYAERNPAADVEGHDAARKICILASLAFGRHVHPEYVHTEGITGITPEDVAYADGAGYAIKLIASAKRTGSDKIDCMVSPALVSRESQLSSIDDVFNGVLVRGNATGDVVFYGKGAGKLPTASAVVADVIEAAKEDGPSRSLFWASCDSDPVADYMDYRSEFYLRLTVDGEVKAAVEAVLGQVRWLNRAGQPADELALICPETTRRALDGALLALGKQGVHLLQALPLSDC